MTNFPRCKIHEFSLKIIKKSNKSIMKKIALKMDGWMDRAEFLKPSGRIGGSI